MQPTIQFQKPSELAVEQMARWAWYADQGVGKSTLAASVGPWLRANYPGRMALVISIAGESVDAYKPYEDVIRVVRINRWDQLTELLLILKNPKNPFYVVIFDTWPSRLAAEKIGGISISPEEWQQVLKTPERLTPRASKGQDGYALWEAIAAIQVYTMDLFYALPLHIAMLFQPEEREKNGITQVAPALTPQAARFMRPAFKLCGYLYTQGGDDLNPRAIGEEVRPRKLLIEKHDLFFAKGPSHVLSAVVTNPSWTKLAESLGSHPFNIEEEIEEGEENVI